MPTQRVITEEWDLRKVISCARREKRHVTGVSKHGGKGTGTYIQGYEYEYEVCAGVRSYLGCFHRLWSRSSRNRYLRSVGAAPSEVLPPGSPAILSVLKKVLARIIAYVVRVVRGSGGVVVGMA